MAESGLAGMHEAEGMVGAAVQRLEEAIDGLEARLDNVSIQNLDDQDRADQTLAQLSSELSQARRREQALQSAAAEASAALGRAAAEIRAALTTQPGEAEPSAPESHNESPE